MSNVPHADGRSARRARVVTAVGLSLAAALVVCCGTASAGLGEPVASVAHDHAALRGVSMTTTSLPRFRRDEIATEDGTMIHEYAAADGTVFAVDFSGPSMPDLKTLLATHYDDYVAAAKLRRGNHHVMTFTSDGLVIRITRLPRGFVGASHIPSLMPAGVSVDDLR